MRFHSWEEGETFFKDLGIKPPRTGTEGNRILEQATRWPRPETETQILSEIILTSMVLWYVDRKPYFSVYPKIAEALLKTPLDFPVKALKFPPELQNGTLLIRLAEGHEIGEEKVSAIHCTSIHFHEDNKQWIIVQAQCEKHDSMIVSAIKCNDKEELLSDLFNPANLKEGASEPYGITGVSEPTLIIRQCAALALGVALLENNSELIVADVLKDDQQKYERATDEERQRLIDKAHRRGKCGWVVGACTEPAPGREVAAHYRRPHFSIRWTGYGRTIPRLCAIKGSVVHREKFLHVPTGFLDNEDKQ